MEEDGAASLDADGFSEASLLPEVEAFAFLLAVIYLIDADRMEVVCAATCWLN